jgi:hypothetical protein
MAIDVGKKDRCRHCDKNIIYRKPLDQEGNEHPLIGRLHWFHMDDRPDWAEGDLSGRQWAYGSNRIQCMPVYGKERETKAEPQGFCVYSQNTGEICGRKIPDDNRREEVYACGIHAKQERAKIASLESHKLRIERDIAEGDLRAWARQEIGKKVATIIDAGLAVRWDSGESTTRYGRETEPAFTVKVNIDDLLEWINDHTR